MNRAKARLADLDEKIATQANDEDRRDTSTHEYRNCPTSAGRNERPGRGTDCGDNVPSVNAPVRGREQSGSILDLTRVCSARWLTERACNLAMRYG
jgi:hypothetical protein